MFMAQFPKGSKLDDTYKHFAEETENKIKQKTYKLHYFLGRIVRYLKLHL